jgi:hypothetical protein
LASHRAWGFVAGLVVVKHRASEAAMLTGGDDVPGVVEDTTAAFGRALAAGDDPICDGAVDSTGLLGTRLGVRKSWAADAAVRCWNRHSASLGLTATVALSRAQRPSAPLTDDACNGTIVEVAVLLIAEMRACVATEGSRLGDCTKTHLVSTIACGGAYTPVTKRGYHAVTRGLLRLTVTEVARLVFVQVRTADARAG